MKSILSSVLALALFIGSAFAAKPKPDGDPSLVPNKDVPGLPRVLIIGDSISMGYTVPVRDLLKGKANVHRIPMNGGPTTNGLKNLAAWLGESKWDVIHFNWGLHDLKYVLDDPNKLVAVNTPGSHYQVKLEDYEKNLATLVTQLQKTGAKLIWCNTTPVPEGSQGRVGGDEMKFNEAAARVMKAAGMPTDDLRAHALVKIKEIQLPANVHYTPAGYKYLAEKVAAEIEKALPKK